jgi:hypothetical protein
MFDNVWDIENASIWNLKSKGFRILLHVADQDLDRIRIGIGIGNRIGSGLGLELGQDRIKLGRGGFWVDSKLSWVEFGFKPNLIY